MLERLARITDIFVGHSWFEKVESSPVFGDAFEKCVAVSRHLDERQFELFCNLLSRFRKIEMGDYEWMLRSSINKLRIEDDGSRVFVGPLLKQTDEGKIKSSSSMMYMFSHSVIPYLKSISEDRIISYMSLKELLDSYEMREGDNFIFVDDFVGTGKTVSKVIDYMRCAVDVSRLNITVVCIGVMERGLRHLEKIKVKCCFHEMFRRGIADYHGEDAVDIYKIMDEIESGLDVGKNYRRGFDESEALVSLINTPNNTFPMFWIRKMRGAGGAEWPAPFPRRKI